ncbi:MAG: DNA repair protein RecN [Oscillospiraceae bacterium]|nr:DNA repair protein RecN [Oscillospiraceae bacterium]
MITQLHLQNIAVIEKADIVFSSGLNVLTGETGAGKSIVIDALSAAIGSRTSRDILRTGADYASVTAVFSQIDKDALPDWVQPDENGEIYVLRKITADGKNVCRANDMPIQLAALRELGSALIDIHGQNDGRKLLDENAHLQYLDAYGGLSRELYEYKEAFDALRDKKSKIEKLTMDEAEKERKIETLKYQTEEIERAGLSPGELSGLTARREMLLNASRLTQSVESAFEALHGGGDTPGAVALISEACGELDHASRFSDELKAFSGRLNDIRYTAEDISDELRDFRAKLDFTPDELDTLEERIDVLKRITRKYHSEDEALAFLERSKAELLDIEDSSSNLIKLEAQLASCLEQAKSLAGELSQKRKEAARRLEEKVKDELSELNMPGVSFIVEFGDVKGLARELGDYGLCPTGADEVWYLMSANAGEAPGRINRIASGGELARIMLALKNVLGGSDMGIMVFDEIDSGVSGVAAQRVGEKLAALARERQVLCVTHLPQIAVMADTHFSITKGVSDGRTFTHVEKLDFEGRKRELARLSGGENITDVTLASAQEQLTAAANYKSGI